MLSDVEIKNYIKNGDITLTDPDGRDVINRNTGEARDVGQLDTHGYCLRADRVYSYRKSGWIALKDVGEYRLRSHEFAIIGTYERIRLSKKVGGILTSITRETLDGLSHDPTTIHPGWALNEPEPAYLVVAVWNPSPMPIVISYKERFLRVMFWRHDQLPELSAPSLDDVKKNFHKMEIEAARYSGTRVIITGWTLLLLSIITSTIILYLVTLRLSNLSAVATALVVVLLTTVISWIRSRYRIW